MNPCAVITDMSCGTLLRRPPGRPVRLAVAADKGLVDVLLPAEEGPNAVDLPDPELIDLPDPELVDPPLRRVDLASLLLEPVIHSSRKM